MKKVLLNLFLFLSFPLFSINYIDKYDPQYKEYNLVVEYDSIVLECDISIFHMLSYYTIDFENNLYIDGHSLYVYVLYKMNDEEFEVRHDLFDRRAYGLEDNIIDDVTIKKIEFVDSNGEVYYAVLNQAIYSKIGEN